MWLTILVEPLITGEIGPYWPRLQLKEDEPFYYDRAESGFHISGIKAGLGLLQRIFFATRLGKPQFFFFQYAAEDCGSFHL